MRNSRNGRIAASLLSSCLLLSNCGTGESGPSPQGPGSSGGRVVPDAPDASHVTIQMTGLLLIVPPATAGDSVQVYLPVPRDVGPHIALLGFVIPEDATVRPDLCDNPEEAIATYFCYVNLEQWKLAPFGVGGTTVTKAYANPQNAGGSGLLDVTHLSGRRFRAFPARARARSVATVSLLSGQIVDGRSCKLAEWKYRRVYPIGIPVPTARRARLANVVEWEMKNLRSPELVFVNSTGETARVALPAGQTRLLLAHIPATERKHLPPNHATEVTPSTHAHFNPFYDLLSQSASGDDWIAHTNTVRRRIPTLKAGDTVPCTITLGTGARTPGGTRSMATYACIPAWGQGE
jgi:hypothetical protein